MPSPSHRWYRLGGLLPMLAAAPLVATPRHAMHGPAAFALGPLQIIQVVVVAGAAGGALGLQQVLVVN